MILILLLFSCVTAKRFEHMSDNLCNHPHYELEMKLIVEYFQDAFYMAVIDVDADRQEHRLNALRCIKMGRHARPFIIFNSIEKIKFRNVPKNSSISTYTRTRGYYVKGNRSEVAKFFDKMSKNNPMVKILIQLTDDSIEISNEVLRIAFENYKMINVATLHRHGNFASLKFFNPYINYGEFHIINVTRQSDLTEIMRYQHDRVWNLHKFPIRIYIYESPMSVKKITIGKTSKIIFSYAEGEMANMLAEKMNFTAIYVLSDIVLSASHNGFQLENGSFTGGIGAIEAGNADLVVNSRLIRDLNTTRAIYLQPITTASYKFVIQTLHRRRYLPLTIFGLFDTPSKVISFTLIASFPIIYMIINNQERKLKCQPKRSLISCCVYICALMNNISMRQTHVAPPISRIIIFVITFYALISSSIFQGNIIREMNEHSCGGHINYVEDLFDDNYKFAINHMLSEVLMKQSGNELSMNLRKIAKEALVVNSEEGMKIVLKNKSFACLLDTLYVSTNYLDRFYDNITGENLLEIVPEKAFEFYVSIMAARDSPLIDPFNQYILKWIEGGFDSYHIRRATDDNSIKTFYEKHKKGLTFNKQFKSLSVEDLLSLFILYACLIAICIIVFLLEVAYYYFSK